MLGLAALAMGLTAGAAQAEDHVIKLRNNDGKGRFMLFEPDFIKVQPGDTVTFVPVDKGHNAETIPEVWPDGAEPFKGAFNEEVELKIDKPGYYGIRCSPHYTMGMVALIVAGEPANGDKLQAFKAPGVNRRFDQLKAMAAAK
jgi:pseudoazurin